VNEQCAKPLVAVAAAIAVLMAGAVSPAGAQQPADPAEINQGKTLFISHGCGWCHEAGGRKAGRCPQLMNDPHDDEFFINRIVGGSAGRMPAFGAILGATDIQAIIAYLRSLKPESE
jgi:mono/diheme cytochrome c family protein